MIAAVRSLPLHRLVTLQMILPILTQLHASPSVTVSLRRAVLQLVHAIVSPVEVFTRALQLSTLPEPLPSLLPAWLADVLALVRNRNVSFLQFHRCDARLLLLLLLLCQDEHSLIDVKHLLLALTGLLPALLAEFLRRIARASSELITQFCRAMLRLCRMDDMRSLLQAERAAVQAFRAAINVRDFGWVCVCKYLSIQM